MAEVASEMEVVTVVEAEVALVTEVVAVAVVELWRLLTRDQLA